MQIHNKKNQAITLPNENKTPILDIKFNPLSSNHILIFYANNKISLVDTEQKEGKNN